MIDCANSASRAFWHRHATTTHAPAVFKTEQEARNVVEQIDDDEWTYKPEARVDGGWWIKVYDEDGTLMGLL